MGLIISSSTINCSTIVVSPTITNHQNITVMNKRQLSTLIEYCKFVFGTTDVPVSKCIAVAELEADYYRLSLTDFLDAIANSKIKLW